MNSRQIFEGSGPFKGGRHRPITPHAGSWADQEAGRKTFRQQRAGSPEGQAVRQHLGMDDMGLPVGPGGQRRFPTSAPGEGGGGPGSTSGILLGLAGYRAWARDMHERGEQVPTWDEGTPYQSEARPSAVELVRALIVGDLEPQA